MTDGSWLEWTHPHTGEAWRYRPDPVAPDLKPVPWGNCGSVVVPEGMEVESGRCFQFGRLWPGAGVLWGSTASAWPSTAAWYEPVPPPAPWHQRLGRFVFVRIRTPFEILRDVLVSWLGCGPSCGCD